MDLSEINISGHAMTRFIARWQENYGIEPVCWGEMLRFLLKRAEERKKSYKRLLFDAFYHGYLARWFSRDHIKGCWIFITTVDLSTLITTIFIPNSRPQRSRKKNKHHFKHGRRQIIKSRKKSFIVWKRCGS